MGETIGHWHVPVEKLSDRIETWGPDCDVTEKLYCKLIERAILSTCNNINQIILIKLIIQIYKLCSVVELKLNSIKKMTS